MKFIPAAISRTVAKQALNGKRHSPTILFGAGVVSMIGSTVLACRATLKLEDVLENIRNDQYLAEHVREINPDDYSQKDFKQDSVLIYTRGIGNIAKLYAPPVLFGVAGVICLTKSHRILQERNVALTAAYVAVEKAFQTYRERVADRYGVDVDRELRYEHEDVDIIDETTGKVVSTVHVTPGDHGLYARWFDSDNPNWNPPGQDHYNWLFLRNQQNWANDFLRARGHLVLNDVYGMLGLAHTSAGAVVGWIYDREDKNGDGYIDFGCWDQADEPAEFFNGREGAILLDFNVDGSIWHLLDERNKKNP